jgi:hypothetical protein
MKEKTAALNITTLEHLMLNVVMQSLVYAVCIDLILLCWVLRYDECHYAVCCTDKGDKAECHCTECRGTN